MNQFDFLLWSNNPSLSGVLLIFLNFFINFFFNLKNFIFKEGLALLFKFIIFSLFLIFKIHYKGRSCSF